MTSQHIALIVVALMSVGGMAYCGAKGAESMASFFGFTAFVAVFGACVPPDLP